MSGIFKAYDIRGIYPEQLNEEIAEKIGRAFVTFLGAKKVVIGRDMRPHSVPLFNALAKGITEQGCDVVDLGLCSTPQTYHANGSLKDDIEYPNYAFIIKKVKSYGEDGTFLTETIYENSGDYVVYYYNGKDQYTKIDRFNAEDKLSYSADYDEKGRLIKESSYNPDGSLIGYSIHEYYSETNSIVTRYDANGNEIGKYDTGDYGSGG